MKNVLLLAYEYAPFNRRGSIIGAQRPAGFAKYLPQFGWRPIVLCCDNEERRIWPEVDVSEVKRRVAKAFDSAVAGEPIVVPLPSLRSADWIDGLWMRLADINENTGTFETKNRAKNTIRKPVSLLKLFKGDHSQAWQSVAIAASECIMQRVKLDMVLAEHGPDASFFVAHALLKKHGIPWIADTRDPVLQAFGGLTRTIAKQALENIISTAKTQISVTPYWGDLAEQDWGVPGVVIPNGYDPEEFPVKKEIHSETFVLSFLGNISLSSNIVPFFEALQLLHEESANKNIRFLHRGSMKKEFQKWAEQFGVEEICDLEDGVDRDVALELMIRSDALVLFAADPGKNNDIYISKGYYPGKVFEYFGAARPIICIGGRNSQLEDLLQETRTGICFDQANEIAAYIKELISNKKSGKQTFLPDSEEVSKYNRVNLTFQLAKLMNSLTEEHRKKTLEIFNADAENRTLIVDGQVNSNTYQRGYLFERHVSQRIKPGSKILDYGCGQGRISYLLANKGYDVFGLEPAKNLVAEAKKQSYDHLKLRFDLLVDDGQSLPGGEFDAIVCSSVLEFVPDADVVLSNFYRALKPGGTLFISLPNTNSLWRYYALLRFGRKYDHFTVQRNRWSRAEAFRHITDAGFSINVKPVFFESAFDKKGSLRFLNRSSLFGTLYLVIAEKR